MRNFSGVSNGEEAIFIEFENATELFKNVIEVFSLESKELSFIDVSEVIKLLAQKIEEKELIIITDEESKKIFWSETF